MDYYEQFVKYARKKCGSMSELTDRNDRRRHNRAMTNLYHLMRDKMYAEPDRCADVALRLMEHPDARVRLSAAAYCIQAEVHQAQALALLHQMRQDEPEKLIRMNAHMTAMCCVPFSRQHDPS